MVYKKINKLVLIKRLLKKAAAQEGVAGV